MPSKEESKVREDLLREAIRHLRNLTDEGICEFLLHRKTDESCSTLRTRIKGEPMPGCSHCQAAEFLKRATKKS